MAAKTNTLEEDVLMINERDIEQATLSPLAIIDRAVSRGIDPAQLGQLLDLQIRWEQNEAKKAFVKALADFKANPPHLEKNKLVDFTTKTGARIKYRHATLDSVADAIGRELSRHGLSFRWQTLQESGRIRVTCHLQHALGHTESVSLEAPPDTSGQKNPIQEIASTVSYLERYTLLAAVGLATTEQDTDGRVIEAEEDHGLTDEAVMDFIENIRSANDLSELQQRFAEAYKAAKGLGDTRSQQAFIKAKDSRKGELR